MFFNLYVYSHARPFLQQPPPHPNPKQTNKNKDIISMILSEKKRHIIISYLILKKNIQNKKTQTKLLNQFT